MSATERGIALAVLLLIFVTGVTLDRYRQTRLGLPARGLRSDAPGVSDGAPPSLHRFDPDEGTELVVRLGGIRLPYPPDVPDAFVPDEKEGVTERERLGVTGPIPGSSEDLDAQEPLQRSADGTSWRIHRVEPNESLWTIAKKYLGDPDDWSVIKEANGIADADANKLRVGQELRIPVR